MNTRSLILMGICAAFGMSGTAFAEPAAPPAKTYLFSMSTPANPVDPESLLPKDKKLTPKQRARALAKIKADLAAKAAPGTRAKTVAAAEVAKPKSFASQPNGIGPRITAERLQAEQAAAVGADTVVHTGNNGELRSGMAASRPAGGFFQILFGDEPNTPSPSASLLPETQALDSVYDQKKKYKVKPQFEPQEVSFSGYSPGTIVIDTTNHFLYYVESGFTARRYGIAVGREGLQFKGAVTVGDKQEWPRWIPTADMQKREPKHYGQFKDGMPGGKQNPLGARAIYLYQGGQDTHLRIHGTIAPQSIGTNASNGCFRMINDSVIELYNKVRVGTQVVII